MRTWLAQRLPPRWAAIATTLWYLALLVAIFLAWREDEQLFLYLRP